MEDIDSSPTSPNPRKRVAQDEISPDRKPLNLKGNQFMVPTPPDTDQSSNASPKYTNNEATREGSPALSTSTLTSIDTIPNHSESTSGEATGNSGIDAHPSTSGQHPAKRRKLTISEKEQQKKDKEAKAAERAERKARKDEEKARKDEERAEQKARKDEDKRAKDEEKRKKAEEREGKRREKELEEEKKVQEKMKKERSQMRLGVFFQMPTTPAKSPRGDGSGSARRKSLSLEPFDVVADQIRRSESPCKGSIQPISAAQTPARPNVSDYCKYFLPFQLQSHSSLAHVGPTRTPEELEALQTAFDHDMNDRSIGERNGLGLVDSFASLETQFANERQFRRGLALPVMRQLVEQIQGSSQHPVDLTEDGLPKNPMRVLQAVPRRHIQFEEDIRPAYFGSYTKIRSPKSCAKLRRNPFCRARDDTNYDYDSEAEWQEEEEGEDVMDDDDDEAESVGEVGEMDAFLDDADDTVKSKRKMITGDLVPASTGLCWEDETSRIIPSVERCAPLEMRGMRMGVLLSGFTGGTIDPFSTAYWQSEPTPAPALEAVRGPIRESPFTIKSALMGPPRPPLQPRVNSNGVPDRGPIGAAEGMKGPITGASVPQKAKPGPKPSAKIISKEDLEEFKEAVVGSQLGKAELLKGLKSRFPKLTNETIKATLGEHFAQVGASKADKKWLFVVTSP